MPKVEWMSTAEAALWLGIHRRSVTRWVETGRLQPIDQLPGRRGAYLFDRAQIEALAAERAAA